MNSEFAHEFEIFLWQQELYVESVFESVNAVIFGQTLDTEH